MEMTYTMIYTSCREVNQARWYIQGKTQHWLACILNNLAKHLDCQRILYVSEQSKGSCTSRLDLGEN
jgi:hypothetical protein